jgi:hypothetical protein
MEYFLGSFITLLTLGLARIYFNSRVAKNAMLPVKPVYRQSSVFELLKPVTILYDYLDNKILDTQATKHRDSMYVRVIFVEDQAYWIKDGELCVSEMENGMVVGDSTKPVDTIGMDKVQLDKIIFIVEKLTEGLEDDRNSSRNKKL